ncbi:MAG: UDP-N-acetylmuramoyl-tripeptide--D-alanyl-D-alanine ligase [Bacteroides sp.]|nr:MAG: UDP-N-acetylmuramoyl-tripeptide--D-alanyl-D-alanine ligase [Bacteroides sp.]
MHKLDIKLIDYVIYNYYLLYNSISTDSRNINDKCIFFALKGKKFDGNQFAEIAIKKGAAIAVVDNYSIYIKNNNFFLVENVLLCLQKCALIHRRRLSKVKIIAITGSNGKTSTKNLLYEILKTKYKVISSYKNYNNEIGVPLSILRMKKNTEIGIIEMGAKQKNDIYYLCNIVNPQYGLITNIGISHIQYFKSKLNILLTKIELFKYIINNNGFLFINNNVKYLIKNFSYYEKKIIYGSYYIDNTNIIGYWKYINNIKLFEWYKNNLNNDIAKNTIKVNLWGSYNIENIIATISVGTFFCISDKIINNTITNYKSNDNRSQLINTENNNIVLDAYNANPNSVLSSIYSFYKENYINKIIILGNMNELGSFSERYHKLIINILSKINVRSFLIGDFFYDLKCNYSNIFFFKNKSIFINFMSKNNFKGNNILIKGSRSMALETLIKYL